MNKTALMHQLLYDVLQRDIKDLDGVQFIVNDNFYQTKSDGMTPDDMPAHAVVNHAMDKDRNHYFCFDLYHNSNDGSPSVVVIKVSSDDIDKINAGQQYLSKSASRQFANGDIGLADYNITNPQRVPNRTAYEIAFTFDSLSIRTETWLNNQSTYYGESIYPVNTHLVDSNDAAMDGQSQLGSFDTHVVLVYDQCIGQQKEDCYFAGLDKPPLVLLPANLSAPPATVDFSSPDEESCPSFGL